MPPSIESVVLSPYFVASVGVILGVIQTFAGYRIFKITLAVAGFVAGALVIASAAHVHTDARSTVLIAALAGGCVGALLLPALYFLGVFLAGAFLGGVVGLSFGGIVSPLVGDVLGLVLAVVIGLVAVKAQKLMIVISTAFGGAWLALASVASVNQGGFGREPFQDRWLVPGFVLWMLLGLVGCLAQYRAAQPGETRPAARRVRRTRGEADLSRSR